MIKTAKICARVRKEETKHLKWYVFRIFEEEGRYPFKPSNS